MKKFCLFALCFFWYWSASGALALTDADYRALMKKAAFAEARELIEAGLPEAAMTVTFKGDRAEAMTTETFKMSGACGMGVELDGTYVRQKVKK